MAKRDDDPHDLEVGMTTAERRRRRRRGGGLRVPSDNVPRRSAPPVVAPVPEDPSLAMSIAYSFKSDGSEPVARVDTTEPIPTQIDGVGDDDNSFETKTREMSAVDLEALGLTDPSGSSSTAGGPPSSGRPARLASPGIEAMSGAKTEPDVAAAIAQPRTTTAPRGSKSGDDEVEYDLDGGTTLDSDPPEEAQFSAAIPIDHAVAKSVNAAEHSRPTRVPEALKPLAEAPPRVNRLQTVSLSDEDMEEVREAVRAASPPLAAQSAPTRPSSPPATRAVPTPAGGDNSNRTQPLSAVDIEIQDDRPSGQKLRTPGVRDSSVEFDVDVDEPVVRKSKPPSTPPPLTPAQRTRPASVPPAVPSMPAAASSPASSTSVASNAVPPAAPPQGQHAPPPPPPTAAAHPAPPASAAGNAGAAAAGNAHPPPPPAVAGHAQGQPPPPPHKAPPSPPPKPKASPPAVAQAVSAKPDAKTDPKAAPRTKQWFVDLFDEDYLRTLPFLTPQATQSEAEFVIDAMGLQPGAQVLDLGCGYGRHAMELAARGFHVVGLDLSTPLLVRGGEEAQRRNLTINFIRGDMRELDFEGQFDGAYCLFSTFGYFDDETNKKTMANVARALKPGGRLLLEILNRDYVIADLPTRVWWEGDGCVVLEEVELNYFSSRVQVNRSVVFDDGRQLEQEISIRAYSLHEIGKLMHAAGFRVLEVSGGYHTRGRFFGNQSRHIIVLAERKDSSHP
ncbi:MAG: methyltransferase domain-containing protein [Kofleriaceae bacterium]